MLQPPNPSSPHSVKLKWFDVEFQPHFNDWVFNPINRLVTSKDALIGFIVMTCSIDYLAGFWWGKSTKGNVQKVYTDFIDTYFPPGHYDATGIYDSLRNGLVHMFTIKNKKYALVHNEPNMHLKKDTTGQIILNAADFRDDLVAARDKYFSEVQTTPGLLDRLLDRFNRDGFLISGPIQIP